MKKVLPFMLLLVLLAGCRLGGNQAQTDAEMATRVAQILTSMPTDTGQPLPFTPTSAETATAEATTPAVIEVTLAPTETATLQPSDTPQPEATATETTLPTEEATATPEATSAGQSGATSTPPATLTPGGPTATFPPTDPRLKLGSPTSTDPMNDSDTWIWPTGDSPFTEIIFKNGYLFLRGLTEEAGWRMPLVQTLPNMYIEMTANPGKCLNRDNYGIIFRVPKVRTPEKGYLFAVSCEGKYALWMWDGTVKPNGKATMLIQWKESKAIQKGSSQWNRLGVLTQGDKITLFINGSKVDEAQNATYKDGAFGIFVNPADDSGKFMIQVDEMSYWLDPQY